MPAENDNLDTKANGEARFAYVGEDPWHRLGVKLDVKDATADQMLAAADADFRPLLTKVIATDAEGQPLRNPDGEWVYVDDSRCTVAERWDGMAEDGSPSFSYFGLSTVGTQYHPVSNREVVERAERILDIAGDAAWETMGCLDNGRRFFGVIHLGRTTVNVRGKNDEITRYLAVINSFNGTRPVLFLPTNIRIVCRNTEGHAVNGKSKGHYVSARHTVNGMSFSDDDARHVLQFSDERAAALVAEAERLVRINADEAFVRKVIAEVWPLADDATDRVKGNHNDREVSILGLFAKETGPRDFAPTGWAAFNAIGEYLDHYRSDDPTANALTSIDPDSWVNKAKVKAQAAILALA